MSDSTIKGYESNLNTHTGDNEEVTVTVDATNNKTYFDVLDKNSVPAGAGSDYDGAALTVSTTEVEAKVGASRMTDRRGVLVHNNSTETIYFNVSPVGLYCLMSNRSSLVSSRILRIVNMTSRKILVERA